MESLEPTPLSPQTEPFPDVDADLDLDFELARLSPAFSRGIDTERARGCSSLVLGPAAEEGCEAQSIPDMVVAQAKWVSAGDDEGGGDDGEDKKGVREATERVLEWAQLLFGKKGEEGGERGR